MAVVDSNSKADYGKADKMGIDTHRRDYTSKDVARFNICNNRQEMPRMAGSTRRRGGDMTLSPRENMTLSSPSGSKTPHLLTRIEVSVVRRCPPYTVLSVLRCHLSS